MVAVVVLSLLLSCLAIMCSALAVATSSSLRNHVPYVEAKANQPACGCGHNLAFHNRDTGKCHAVDVHKLYELPEAPDPYEYNNNDVLSAYKRWMKSTSSIVERQTQITDCRCQQYTGPDYLPEILG